MISVEKPGSPSEILHFGTKGMKWGVRKEESSGGGGGGSGTGSTLKRAAKATGKGLDNTLFELGANTNATTQHIANTAHKSTKKELPGIKAKHGDYGKLRNRAKHPFSPEAKAYRADVKKAYVKNLEAAANSMTNVAGTRQYTLSEHGDPNSNAYIWRVSSRPIAHAADGSFSVRPVFDDEGYIIDFEVVNDDIAQTMDLGANFLKHIGLDI